MQKKLSVSTIPGNVGQNSSLESDSSDSSVINNNNGSIDKHVANSVEVPNRQSTAVNFENMIDLEEISRNVGAKAINLICRSVQRISLEVKILDLLSCHLKRFRPNLQIMPFGSATYGFGGSSTDFNILVNAGAGNKHLPCSVILTFPHTLQYLIIIGSEFVLGGSNSHEAQHLFEKFIKTPDLQTDFQVLDTKEIVYKIDDYK